MKKTSILFYLHTKIFGAGIYLFLIFFLCVAATGAIPLGKGIGAYIVTTIAGNGMRGAVDGSKEKARFNWPTGVAVDDKGNIYIADFSNNLIRKITTQGEVATFIGSGRAAFTDGKGRDAHLNGPDNIAMGAGGTIYVADADNFRIRKVETDGIITTIAGNGTRGYKDGHWQTAIAIDGIGNIYVCDSQNNRVRRVTPEGVVSTVAGIGISGFADGSGHNAMFNFPTGVEIDKAGNIYVADSGNNRIRKISQGGILHAKR